MKGRNYPEAENKVFLTGELAGISKRTNTILTMRLDMSENGKRNMIEAIYYNAPASLAHELSIGGYSKHLCQGTDGGYKRAS